MNCVAVPNGYELIGRSNPWKRLWRWMWRVFAVLSAIAAATALAFAIDSRGECRSRRCEAEAEDAQELAMIFGSMAGALLFWTLLFACFCWLAREHRAELRPKIKQPPGGDHGKKPPITRRAEL